MWFKNLVVYRFYKKPEFDEQSLEEKLADAAFNPVGSQELFSQGWTPPLGENSAMLAHHGSGFTLLKLRREERILPPAVVRDFVNDKVREIEQREDRKVGRKERGEIKDDMVLELLPRAFTRSSYTSGLLMPEQGWLVVDAASAKKAEEWTSLLRKTLGTLAIKPVAVNDSPVGMFTAWLGGKATPPASLEIGGDCELRATDEEGAVIRCQRQDLGGDEIKAHLDADKVVTKLAMEWDASLSFMLTDGLEIKRLRFSDTLLEKAAEEGSDDAAAEFDANFTLMSLELARFLPALWEVFGGELIEQ